MKVVLSIAGSDSSGGAGIQADLKTFEAFGVFGTSVITVLTAQNTMGVTDIHDVDAGFIKKQISAVLSDFDVAAIKIGMLYSKEIISLVREVIKELDIPVVLDPVFISKVGSPLLQKDAIEEMKTLFEYVTLLTPNSYEAHELFGYRADVFSSSESIRQSKTPILVKHHIVDSGNTKVSRDVLFSEENQMVFETPLLDSTSLHGTGCSYSSAITACLALGMSLKDAISTSKNFVFEGISDAPNIGNGAGPINHKRAGLKVQELLEVQFN